MATVVVVMGLGEIGRRVARAVLTEPALELVAAVDNSPTLAGRSLAEVLQAAAPDGAVAADLAAVKARVDKALSEAAGELDEGEEPPRKVLLHCTGSRLDQVAPQLEAALRNGYDIVSTCEELACPWVRHERLADRLDRLAEKHGVTLMGTGANPGFVLDRLAAVLAQATGKVERVEGRREVDLRTRREALQRKLGLGLEEAAFHAQAEQGGVGHVGLMESAALAAMGAGHACDEVDEELLPVLATRPHTLSWGAVAAGQVCGVRQVARAFSEGREVARLSLELSLECDEPFDEVTLCGEPRLTLRIPGGTPGDDATAWTVVHAAAAVGRGAQPGLLTVLELPAGR